MTEPMLYTLKQAKLELAKKECARFGHDFEIVVKGDSDAPVSVLCRRCGKAWRVDAES